MYCYGIYNVRPTKNTPPITRFVSSSYMSKARDILQFFCTVNCVSTPPGAYARRIDRTEPYYTTPW